MVSTLLNEFRYSSRQHYQKWDWQYDIKKVNSTQLLTYSPEKKVERIYRFFSSWVLLWSCYFGWVKKKRKARNARTFRRFFLCLFHSPCFFGFVVGKKGTDWRGACASPSSSSSLRRVIIVDEFSPIMNLIFFKFASLVGFGNISFALWRSTQHTL